MLREYARKRNFEKTSEPRTISRRGANKQLSFVVQKHAARRLHYDFRLEVDGVLVSWAVPKGPSLDPAEKRLAVKVEDHPLDYATFEGTIPKGEYGGGEVIVWDRGTYSIEGDSDGDGASQSKAIKRAIKRGKLSILLKGKKLQGIWTLVKIKDDDKNWLLIKHNDNFADPDKDVTEADKSVLSGTTISDLKDDPQAASCHQQDAIRQTATACICDNMGTTETGGRDKICRVDK